MRVAVDTNILVQYLVDDSPTQADAVGRLLEEADEIFISAPVLCEVVWVLTRVYKLERAVIAAALRVVERQAGIIMDVPVFDAGLAMLEDGGDFADGVILQMAMQARCDRLATFDRKLARKAGASKVILLDP